MSFKNTFTSVIASAIALTAFAGLSYAQDASAAPKADGQKQEKLDRKGDRRGNMGRRGIGHGGHRGFPGLRAIQLTDAQKEQVRLIHESNKPDAAAIEHMKAMRESFKAGTTPTPEQKEQMKAMREQRRAKAESTRQQILAILTPEQRQQLDTRRTEMEKRMKDRKEFRKNRKTGDKIAPDGVKPSDN
ncbi:MAG: Spy/CpxP family protein refolding chaperone [Acidobacteriota bacterium]